VKGENQTVQIEKAVSLLIEYVKKVQTNPYWLPEVRPRSK
jgi:hypothetical protein